MLLSQHYYDQKTCCWNIRRGISKGLWSLQEMDQRVNDCCAGWHEKQFVCGSTRAKKFHS